MARYHSSEVSKLFASIMLTVWMCYGLAKYMYEDNISVTNIFSIIHIWAGTNYWCTPMSTEVPKGGGT
jgi:hypothetical protein